MFCLFVLEHNEKWFKKGLLTLCKKLQTIETSYIMNLSGVFSMRAREGELIKTKDNVIFDVKGLVHPPNKVIAFPRFIPSPRGSRGHRTDLYRKVYSLTERFKFLEQKAPDLIVHDPVFDETLCEVPIGTIKKHYKPIEKLRRLRSSKTLGDLERKAVQLAETLKEAADIPWSSVGISGSLLVGLHTPASDIDPVVYGVENCRKAYAALQSLLKADDSHFKPYSRGDLQALFDFRSKDTIMSFEDFARVESRKAFQGKFNGTDYFIRFVKDWSQTTEQYGDVCYRNCGYAKVAATVADDSEALFTPCTYRIENAQVIEGSKLQPILEIASFRGRFCEQARKGEAITAQGKVERVIDKKQEREYYRLILGNKPSDYMALPRV
jgi:predicted nucleotidyltransferase